MRGRGSPSTHSATIRAWFRVYTSSAPALSAQVSGMCRCWSPASCAELSRASKCSSSLGRRLRTARNLWVASQSTAPSTVRSVPKAVCGILPPVYPKDCATRPGNTTVANGQFPGISYRSGVDLIRPSANGWLLYFSVSASTCLVGDQAGSSLAAVTLMSPKIRRFLLRCSSACIMNRATQYSKGASPTKGRPASAVSIITCADVRSCFTAWLKNQIAEALLADRHIIMLGLGNPSSTRPVMCAKLMVNLSSCMPSPSTLGHGKFTQVIPAAFETSARSTYSFSQGS
mmetsp:Transcript_34819/g.90921  ORF Transcript_34819/g.90921 Transcript_34819/m.90921 type:complete len:287 (+) Transcript_34819:557-1417(+)